MVGRPRDGGRFRRGNPSFSFGWLLLRVRAALLVYASGNNKKSARGRLQQNQKGCASIVVYGGCWIESKLICGSVCEGRRRERMEAVRRGRVLGMFLFFAP